MDPNVPDSDPTDAPEPLLGRDLCNQLAMLAHEAGRMALATCDAREGDLAAALRLLAAFARQGHAR